MARGHKHDSAVVIAKIGSPPEPVEAASSHEPFAIPEAVVWITLAMLSAFSLLTFYYPVLRAFYRYEINYNEGWNVYVTQTAVQHRDLYPGKGGGRGAGYPFLSFYLVGYVSHFIGNYLLVGRVLSLLALLLSCCLVSLIVRRLTGRWAPAVFGGVFCLGLFCSRAPLYIGVDDPQMLAHPFFLLGLWLYLQEPPGTRRLAGITSLFILGGNIKHNLLPAPISVLSDLFTTSLGKALRFVVLGVFFLALSIAVNMLVGGPSFVSNMLAARPYSLESARGTFSSLYSAQALPLAVSAFWSIAWFGNRQTRVLSLYFFSSLLVGAAFAGGAGVNVNTFFDNFFAMSIIMGASLDWLWKAPVPGLGKGGAWRFLVPVLLYSMVIMAYAPRAFTLPKMLSELPLRQKLFKQEASFLAAQPGPAICESLILCYDAGKPYTVSPYNLHVREIRGLRSDDLVQQIAERKFGAIQTDTPVTQKPSPRFPHEVLEAIDRYYIEALKAPECHIYVPRP